MKKIILMAVAGLLATQAAIAQNVSGKSATAGGAPVKSQPEPRGNGKISGQVQDGQTKAPVEFASVALMNKATGKIVDGATTDSKGRFSIAGVAAGQYKLSVTFVGYESITVDQVAVGDGKEEVQVGVVVLKPSAKALTEVTVTGERPLIEDKVDRIVYNADKDIQSGGTAADVMRKVPGLTVDLEGNMQLRGSTNIRVLINNKPSAVMASSVADALLQIPADQIKFVEVITSPSAKYDAEGTAGIVNIITKKEGGVQGLTGNVFAGYGNLNSNASGNMNYRRGKVGVNSTLGFNRSNMHGKNTVRATYGAGAPVSGLLQETDAERTATSTYVQVGADYELSKKSYIAAGVRLGLPDVTFETTQLSTSTFASGPNTSNTRKGNNHFEGENYDINLDYTKTFNKPGQEFSLLGLLSRNTRNNDNFMSLYQDEQLAQHELNVNEAYNEEMTLQTDYSLPLKENHLLEIGTKAIWRYAESDYRFSVARPANVPFVIHPNRTDVFDYDQDVFASYATYSLKLGKKYTFKAGLRYEHTEVQGDFKSNGTQVTQSYDNLFPSLSASKNLSPSQTIKFNYSRRIQRPQLFYLNPYENLSNPKNVVRGNPELEAELTDSYELGYSTFFKSGVAITTSVYLHQTNNPIQQISTPYSGTEADSVGRVTTTVGNVGVNSDYGFSFSGSAKFLEKGKISSNINLFYTSVKGGSKEFSNAGMVYNTNLNASYSFKKGVSAQLAGSYNSPQVNLQGKVSSWVSYNLAVRKEVLNSKGYVSVGVYNPFDRTVKQQRTVTRYNTDNALVLDQRNTWNFYMRQVRVGFNYQFGKQDAKAKPRRVKKVTNEDTKDGDGAAVQ